MSLSSRAIFLLLATSALAAPAMAASVPPRPATGDTLMVAIAYSSVVYQLQVALNANGFDAGPADGLMGNRTRSAITSYQQQNGLLVTGQPSQSLLQHLQAKQQPATAGSTTSASERDIERLQRGLGRLGYDVSASGRIDKQTQEAVRAYQRDQKLLVTGEVNEALISHVRDTLRDRRQDRRADGQKPDADTVAQIQSGLRARGYSVSNVEGRFDDATREAIRSYQRDRGDAVTGEPTPALATQLAEGLPESLDTRENIRLVQQELNRRGYSAGPADGVMGPSTRDSIQSYRRQNNLPVSTSITAELLTSLGIGTTTGDTTTPSPDTWTTALYDSFEDGDFTANPHWVVLAKSFTIADGTLQSTVTAPQASNQDIGQQVFKGILGQVLGVDTRQNNSAAIAQGAGISEAFKIQVRVRVRNVEDTPNPQMHFGPYRGTNAVQGYRVMYDGAASQPLAILAVDDSGATVIASTSQPTNMEDGNWHTIDFHRSDDGELTLRVDGARLLAATHQQQQTSGFGGFSFINAAGTWGMDDVRVEARPE